MHAWEGFVEFRIEGENDVVHRESQIKTTAFIELNNICYRKWRLRLLYIREGTAVPHRLKGSRTFAFVEAKKFPDTISEKPVPLSKAVFRTLSARLDSINDGFRNE